MRTEVRTEKLISDFKTLAHDAEDLLKATAHEIDDKARGRLQSAVESARTSLNNLQDRVVDGAKATDKTIREHPYESIGIAFGVGLLIGVLVSRK